MDLIDQFIGQYRKEFDYYQAAAQMVERTLGSNLQAQGIRAIVTSRAKDVLRTEVKCRKRAPDRSYREMQDIYDDLVDLSGVRVALYFPGDRARVRTIVKQLFDLLAEPIDFPKAGKVKVDKRFSGYAATHYRIRMKEAVLDEPSKRYSSARIEIQVASVLMHAWAEVEHDLAYKPTQVNLSREEEAILDELNGLVLAGEIALERLQEAGEIRVSQRDRQFANHYDLAAHLLAKLATIAEGPLKSSGLGRVDQLFDLTSLLDLNTPEAIDEYLGYLHGDLESRPLADQVIDAVLAADRSRYEVYLKIRDRYASDGTSDDTDYHLAVGHFIAAWVEFERLMNEKNASTGARARATAPSQFINALELSAPALYGELVHLRRMRNQLVHGVERYEARDLRSAAQMLVKMVQQLKSGTPTDD